MMSNRGTRQIVRAALVVVAMTSVSAQSWAWGREGHRLVADVAMHFLTPAAQAQIAELLAADSRSKETLSDVAPWADEYRQDHPESAPWHFVDIPGDALKYDRDRDCPKSS